MLVGFIREIPDVDFVMEIVSERFDDAVNFMTEGSVIYGGAVRDVLAGIPIEGDLDLAVSRHEFNSIRRTFETAPKWVEISNAKSVKDYGKKQPSETSMARRLLGDLQATTSSSRLHTMKTFRNLHGMEAQVLVPAIYGDNPLDEAMSLAKDVDIVCCGVFMTRDGRVFEAVPGAYDDCVKRVLRFNADADPLHIEALPKRVAKLVARGWTSEIDVRSIMVKHARARKKKEKPAQREDIVAAGITAGSFTLTDSSSLHIDPYEVVDTGHPESVYRKVNIPVAQEYQKPPTATLSKPSYYSMSITVPRAFSERAIAAADSLLRRVDSNDNGIVKVEVRHEGPFTEVMLAGPEEEKVLRAASEIKEANMRAEREGSMLHGLKASAIISRHSRVAPRPSMARAKYRGKERS